MTTSILAAPAAVCQTCLGYQVVPNPARGAAWMACPECGGSDDPWPDAAALPAGPVGRLDVWAVAADESACLKITDGKANVADAAQVAVTSARIVAPHPRFRGGELRVCDEAGNVWHRVPIRAAA